MQQNEKEAGLLILVEGLFRGVVLGGRQSSGRKNLWLIVSAYTSFSYMSVVHNICTQNRRRLFYSSAPDPEEALPFPWV